MRRRATGCASTSLMRSPTARPSRTHSDRRLTPSTSTSRSARASSQKPTPPLPTTSNFSRSWTACWASPTSNPSQAALAPSAPLASPAPAATPPARRSARRPALPAGALARAAVRAARLVRPSRRSKSQTARCTPPSTQGGGAGCAARWPLLRCRASLPRGRRSRRCELWLPPRSSPARPRATGLPCRSCKADASRARLLHAAWGCGGETRALLAPQVGMRTLFCVGSCAWPTKCCVSRRGGVVCEWPADAEEGMGGFRMCAHG
mmetsp:Transcript_53084/g.146652  ORF Transcript_53084/g.146652 Transcript_53084/m.146652 type:complete len:264 (+) Transcript_53084:484-1275(+)